MADQLEEIKRRIDIVEFINGYIPLKKAGRNFKALCPFHSEDTPSFIVSPERQIWHCFGQCGEGGDIFKFLMKIENIDFSEALRELAKRAGVKLIRYQPTEGEREKQLLYEINHLASEFYHYLLLNHLVGKRALNYILGRGISKESLEKFKLGYAPNQWDGVQKFLVGKKGYRVEDLEKAGLVIKGQRFYDRFRGRLMFPLEDHRGNICGFAGRLLDPRAKEAKYINTPETLIYHKSDLLYGLFETKEEIKKADNAVLVEGELDAISSYQAGVKNVVAIKGSALTENQVRLLVRFSKNLIFSLDADIAGDQAARRGIETADALGMAIKVVELKEAKDPDEMAQKKPQVWQKLVKEAVPVYDYFFDSAFSRFDVKTIEGKRKIGEELVVVLAKITNEIIVDHYVKQLAERLGVSEEAIREEIGKIKNEKLPAFAKAASFAEAAAKAESAGKEKPNRREILEEHLLALGFQSGKWDKLHKRLIKSLVKTPRFESILIILADYLKKHKNFLSQRLAKMLPAELKEVFDKFYLFDLADLIVDEEKWEQEWQKTINQLTELDLKEKLKVIAEKIKRLEGQKILSTKDEESLKTLYREFKDLSQKLA